MARRWYSKLVNTVAPDTVDERALAFPKKGKALNVWERHGNANLALDAARAAGCKVVNCHAEDIADCVARHSARHARLCAASLWHCIAHVQRAGVHCCRKSLYLASCGSSSRNRCATVPATVPARSHRTGARIAGPPHAVLLVRIAGDTKHQPQDQPPNCQAEARWRNGGRPPEIEARGACLWRVRLVCR